MLLENYPLFKMVDETIFMNGKTIHSKTQHRKRSVAHAALEAAARYFLGRGDCRRHDGKHGRTLEQGHTSNCLSTWTPAFLAAPAE